MLAIIWQFKVEPGKTRDFEEHYSSDGTWADLFRKSVAYRGTQLLRDTKQPAMYVTIDSWDDLSSYEAFKQEFSLEYQKLDRSFESLTVDEQHIGTFVVT